MEYLLHLAIIIALYSTLAISLDLAIGHLGLLSLAHGAFFGIGAYTTAILSTTYSFLFLITALLGMFIAMGMSLVIALSSMRLRHEYFVLTTFAFQIITFDVFKNWISLTRGPLGIAGIPHPSLMGWKIDGKTEFLLVGIGLVTIAFFLSIRIVNSPLGRVLHGIREDEKLTTSVGKNTLRPKIIVFSVSSALAALAGSLYSQYFTFIDPTSFSVMESVLLVSMVILGGSASRWGPILGCTLLVLLPEALRFTGIQANVASKLQHVFYGTALVILMIMRPKGLLGEYDIRRKDNR